MKRFLFAVLSCAVIGLSAVARADAPAPKGWEITPDGPVGLELMNERFPWLHMGTDCWGPGWKFFGFFEGGSSDGADRVYKRSTPIGGTGKPLALDFRVHPVGDGTTSISYTFSAQQESDLTGISFTIWDDKKIFHGGKVIGTLEDGSTHEYDGKLHAGAIPGDVLKQLAFETADGQRVTIDINPPRKVESEGGANSPGVARIWLLRNHIAVDNPVTTTLTIRTPTPVKFYAAESDAVLSNQTADWFPFPVSRIGTPIDLSGLNKDANGKFVPAGAHGFVKIAGERFTFEDGTPARFWGVNVTAAAAIASEDRAVQMADRLSKLGINIVRLHHLDSDWTPNLIDRYQLDGTTQHFNAKHFQQLDKLIFELKRRGIYVLLDPWVGRSFRPGDQIENSDKFDKGNFGLHPYIFFDPKIQALNKQYLQAVWTHVNEYTNVAYKDEPAIMGTELCNEFLFNLPKVEPYRSNFIELYKDWCAKNNVSDDKPELVVQQNWPINHQKFYQSVMTNFFTMMYQFDRQELGLRIPINASNWIHWPWEIAPQATADFMDSHHYYGGNGIGPGSGVGGLWVANPPDTKDSPFAPIAALAVLGKPMTSSELGNNPPKTYRSAYYVGLAAVASLQGWDSLTAYAYSQYDVAPEKLGEYSFESDPATLASIAAGALIYRRGDVQPARELAVMSLSPDEQYAMHYQDEGKGMFQNTPEFRCMVETHKVAVVLGDQMPDKLKPAVVMTPADAVKYVPPSTQLKSDTGELWRDWAVGVGTLDTPRSQAAYGKLGENNKTWSTSDCTFDIDNPFATVVLSSMTSQPINATNHLLLTAVARAENAGQTYNLSMTKIVKNGQGPVMVEPVTGSVTFSTSQQKIRAFAVSADGKLGAELPVQQLAGGKVTVQLSAKNKSLFYVILAG